MTPSLGFGTFAIKMSNFSIFFRVKSKLRLGQDTLLVAMRSEILWLLAQRVGNWVFWMEICLTPWKNHSTIIGTTGHTISKFLSIFISHYTNSQLHHASETSRNWVFSPCKICKIWEFIGFSLYKYWTLHYSFNERIVVISKQFNRSLKSCFINFIVFQ